MVDLTPHGHESAGCSRSSADAILLVAVAVGRVHGIAGSDRFEVHPGQVLVLDTRVPLRSQVDEEVKLFRILMDRSRVPLGVLTQAPLPAAVLSESPVVHTSLAGATHLLRRSRLAVLDDDHDSIRQLITGLHTGILFEVFRQHPATARSIRPVRGSSRSSSTSP